MSEFHVGSTVVFGSYVWRILEIRDFKALIITENIIEQHPYNHISGQVTWAECGLRQYLNGDFLARFTEEERSRIVPTQNMNDSNPWYESDGGEGTSDYVFLLSIEECVSKYFGDSSQNLQYRSPKQRYWFQRKDPNNSRRKATYDGYVWWWWLRSPGRDNKRAAYVHGDGNIGIQGNGTYRYSSNTIHPVTGDNSGGVRPVLWLSMGK